MQQIGKVLWWDARDSEGVLVDSKGNEIYFNKSVFKEYKNKSIEGKLVLFDLNKEIRHSLCATFVTPVPSRSVSKMKKVFEEKIETNGSSLVA